MTQLGQEFYRGLVDITGQLFHLFAGSFDVNSRHVAVRLFH